MQKSMSHISGGCPLVGDRIDCSRAASRAWDTTHRHPCQDNVTMSFCRMAVSRLHMACTARAGALGQKSSRKAGRMSEHTARVSIQRRCCTLRSLGACDTSSYMAHGSNSVTRMGCPTHMVALRQVDARGP